MKFYFDQEFGNVSPRYVTFFFISVKKAELSIPRGSGCGGWCAQVVIMRPAGDWNWDIDCQSRHAPASNCETDGFSPGMRGTTLTATFNDNDCSPLRFNHQLSRFYAIKFRLYTPVGGYASDWCVSRVYIQASNGTHFKHFMSRLDKLWVGQGDWAREHWAYEYEPVRYPRDNQGCFRNMQNELVC